MPSVNATVTAATKPGEGYTAIVLAGKRPGVDPVAAANGEIYKAMVLVAGKPMLTHVVSAVCRSDRIAHLIIVAGEGLADIQTVTGFVDAADGKPVSTVTAKQTLSDSVLGAIASQPEGTKFLVTTSDHPLLTTEMVDDFLERAETHSGVSIAFVDQQTIESAHRNMKRTYLRFRGVNVSGANLFAFNGKNGLHAVEVFRRIEANRKSPLKMVATFGLVNLIGFVTRAFTLDQAFRRISKITRCPMLPVRLQHANAAVDVDRLADLRAVEKIFASRATTDSPS